MRFNHPILLLQTIRLWLCFLSIWWGNLTPFFPTIRSHTLWRRRSVLLLIGIDRSYCRNNKSRLPRRLGPHPKHCASTVRRARTPLPATHGSSGTSTRRPHQLWRSSEYHPLHPISWRNHCFTTISIPLFIRKPHAYARTSADNASDKPGWKWKNYTVFRMQRNQFQSLVYSWPE